MHGPTPPQTVGPFFRFGMDWMAAGQGPLVLYGTVSDGEGAPVPDAVVELWGGATGGFARSLTDHDGSYRVSMAEPGDAGDGSAPHIDVSVFARGLLQRLVTRLYFPDEARNEADPVLRSVPVERRATLVAVTSGAGGLRFDIRLQGDGETVFFAW